MLSLVFKLTSAFGALGIQSILPHPDLHPFQEYGHPASELDGYLLTDVFSFGLETRLGDTDTVSNGKSEDDSDVSEAHHDDSTSNNNINSDGNSNFKSRTSASARLRLLRHSLSQDEREERRRLSIGNTPDGTNNNIRTNVNDLSTGSERTKVRILMGMNRAIYGPSSFITFNVR